MSPGKSELSVGSTQLSDTQVSEAGLEHLKGLWNLRTLNLSDTQITDAGREHFKELTSLPELNLGET